MLHVRRTTLSCLLALADSCGAGGSIDDALPALTGTPFGVAPSTLDASDPRFALAALDGVSTVAPALAETGVVRDGATVVPGSTVRVFEFDDASGIGAASDFVGELAPSEFAAIAVGSAILVMPLQPLAPRGCFVVVLTRDIRDADGARLHPSRGFAGIKKIKAGVIDGLAVRQLQEAARRSGLSLAQVARVQALRNRGVREVLAAVHQSAQACTVQLAPTGLSTDQLGVPGGADIYVGTIEVPLYTDPADPLGDSWTTADGEVVDSEHPLPALRAVRAIPVNLTVPNADSGRTAAGTS